MSLLTILFASFAPTYAAKPFDFNVCSTLDFSGLKWQSGLSKIEKNVIVLALNISGSYEGGDSWQNLTDNFDEQGLSLGLLNQCLGQGSLQPLLIGMRDQFNEQMHAVFSPEQYQDVTTMLQVWEGNAPNPGETHAGFSRLDDEVAIRMLTGNSMQQSDRDKNSVDWAVAILYSDKAGLVFRPEWKTALAKFAATAGYRTIQLDAAMTYHSQTLRLFRHFLMTEVRSYLFFFDIMVQDGGISDEVLTEIDAELAKMPNATEKRRLKKILEMRLKYVKPPYVSDVRSRKMALINGTGVVHGVMRNFDKEYCTDLGFKMDSIRTTVRPQFN